MEDAIVCGGGPAGLAAAQWLGRYRRKTLVIDGGEQRNLATHAVHGYLTRDGVGPAELVEVARSELQRYDTVSVVQDIARSASREGDAFVIETENEGFRGHRVLLATGVRDIFPDIPGFDEHYGTSIFHCACCDGYEAKDQEVLAIGWGEHAAGFALDLLDWGARVTLVTNGQPYEGDRSCEIALARHQVEVIEESVVELVASDGRLEGARLESGRLVPASKAFFSIGHEPRSELARSLGCRVNDDGYIVVGDHGETSVEGVYAAGDVTPGEQLVQTAAAEGAVAGIACALSLRGKESASPAPDPGPDPEAELPG